MFQKKRLIAEFEEQSFTQIIFPHADTDWTEYLREAELCFINIIKAITEFQKCLVVCADVTEVKKHFKPHPNLFFVEYKTNDTWARDCSCLCVSEEDETKLLNFTFNGWGNKFEATKDNTLSHAISNCYKNSMEDIDFVLEGGALESNGADKILTTTHSMLNANRNRETNAIEITKKLKSFFGMDHILYLNHGYLAGDDTDSHIDTLARFINKDTIMYVACHDEADEHYHQLQLMQEELSMIAQEQDLHLIPLPFPDAIYYDKERLPATYANFLFVNGAVLVPTYGVTQDKEAIEIFTKTFPTRKIIPIDCSVLIRQHGSLHCVSMNFARSVLLTC